MKPRWFSLLSVYVKSSFSFSLPPLSELKKPKVLIKTAGLALAVLALALNFAFVFVVMNLNTYAGLKPLGLQELMLFNAATTASLLIFVLAFLTALSTFSMSNIESGFLVLPFSSRDILAAKMLFVYLMEVLAGFFFLAIALVIYGIKEGPPIMFYFNGFLCALALPLLPTALAYLILVPFMNMSKFFRSKNFILYAGGLIGLAFALAFNLYIQSAMVEAFDPAALASLSDKPSWISQFGKIWPPSWLTWISLSRAARAEGFFAFLGNLALGAGGFAAVVFLFGEPYVRSIRNFGESSFSRKRLAALGGSGEKNRIFMRQSAMRALIVREIKLMNREPMYLVNGPLIIILMPVIMAIAFIAQRKSFEGLMSAAGPLLAKGAGAYLLPAAFGSFLGTATSIACTSVSRDAKALPWIRALPVSPLHYFTAKLAHAELFSLLGVALGCGSVALLLRGSVLDTAIGVFLALLFTAAFNMGGLWLDTAFPRLRWDNPIAAMKQNPNAIVAILGSMGIIGGLGALSAWLALPRYGYALLYGAALAVFIVVWLLFYPSFAARRYEKMEG